MKVIKRALVCDADGFIGWHLINRLKSEGYRVRGIDLKESHRHITAQVFKCLFMGFDYRFTGCKGISEYDVFITGARQYVS